MLPPALGGLRVLRAAGPGASCTREYGKDQVVMRSPARRLNYTTSALSPSNSKIKKPRRGEMRLRRGQNRISPDDRREEPRDSPVAQRSGCPTSNARSLAQQGRKRSSGRYAWCFPSQRSQSVETRDCSQFILQCLHRRDNHLRCFPLHKAESRRSTCRLHVRKARP